MCHTAAVVAKKSSSTRNATGAAVKASAPARSRAATLKTAVKGPTLPDLPKLPKLSPEESRARLQRLGIITASGELTELYR